MESLRSASTDEIEDRFDWVVYQAEGMISAQASVSIGEASLRLDEYAHRHGETKHEVAANVVQRRLRFDP